MSNPSSPEKQTCPRCKGKGFYYYDEHHGKPCEVCCKHDQGWWLLEEHYGENNGKLCCMAGCGATKDDDGTGRVSSPPVTDYERAMVEQAKPHEIVEVKPAEPSASEPTEVTLGTKQCAEIALYMYEQWQEAMKPPLFAYYDFPTWLVKVKEKSDE